MKKIGIVLLVFCSCVVLAPLPLSAQQRLPQYTVVDLGTLGGTFTAPGGMSNSGWVEGWATLADGNEHAFLWHNGVMTDLGTLGGPNSDSGWPPSDSGNAAGGAETGAVDPHAENYCAYNDNLLCLAFFWRSSTKKMEALPTLGGNNGYGAGVNDWDEVAGNAENTNPEPACAGTTQHFQFEPVLWINGRVKQLPNFPGDPDGAANGINYWGQAIGWSGNCWTPLHALLWQDGKVTNLGNLGGTQAEAIVINNVGQVCGFSTLPGDQYYHAFLWTWGKMTDLGTLPGDVSSAGYYLNDWGQVVGPSYDASGNSRAFIWQNGVMTDLNTIMPPNSPFYLLAGMAINDEGQIALMALQTSSGDVHALLATPSYGDAVSESATTAATEHPNVTLPEDVRKLLERHRGFKGGLLTTH
jgi:probable HAF family extracellular repeat protein